MPSFGRWDILAVNYPFVEGYESKRRPVLSLTDAPFFEAYGHYLCAMITTAKDGIRPGDIVVTESRETGLPEFCVIRPARISPIAPTSIVRRLGTLTVKDRRAVSGFLKRVLPT
jgi:mRNA-degrading endonuclease toxin of MazEF toxin-antitoxin module